MRVFKSKETALAWGAAFTAMVSPVTWLCDSTAALL